MIDELRLRVVSWVPAHWRKDLITVVALTLASVVFSASYLSGWQGPYGFYQERTGPAVMLAMGRGFVNPDVEACPPLKDFLNAKAWSIPASAIPTDLRCTPPNTFQLEHRYLYTLIGVCWKLFGLSWGALIPLFCLFYTLTVLASYTLFRLAARPWLAAIGAAFILLSPVHIQMLPALRDYAKAPFLLAAFALMGVLAIHPIRPSRLAWISAFAGLLIGLGIGFRMDMVVCVPAFVALILLFLPGEIAHTLRLRVLCVVGFLAAYYLTAYPILSAQSAGSNTWHFFVLGLTSPFNYSLGVNSTPWSMGLQYRDELSVAIAGAFSGLQRGGSFDMKLYTPEYDATCQRAVMEYARHFPADMAIRGLAAIIRVLEELPANVMAAFGEPTLIQPPRFENGLVVALYRVRLMLLLPFAWLGRYIMIAAFAILSARRPRLALFLVLFVAYFAGHTALQFQLRHVFHLEFLTWWCLLFLITCASIFLDRMRSPESTLHFDHIKTPSRWRRALPKRIVLFCLIWGAVAVGPLYLLRTYQQHHLHYMFQDYANAGSDELALQRTDLGQGRVLLQPTQLARDEILFPNLKEDMPQRADYIAVEVQVPADTPVEFIMAYQAARSENDLSAPITLRPGYDRRARSAAPETYTCYLPLYETGKSFWLGERRFTGIVVNKSDTEAIRSVRRVRNPGRLPLLMYLVLPRQWQMQNLYQTLR